MFLLILVRRSTPTVSFNPAAYESALTCWSGRTDTITYFCTIVGAFRAGCCAFLISTRNAPVAVAEMAKRTGITHLFVSPDVPMNGLADEAVRLLAADGMDIKKHAMPSFGDLFPDVRDEHSLYEKKVEFPASYNIKAPCTIMHSSGM